MGFQKFFAVMLLSIALATASSTPAAAGGFRSSFRSFFNDRFNDFSRFSYRDDRIRYPYIPRPYQYFRVPPIRITVPTIPIPVIKPLTRFYVNDTNYFHSTHLTDLQNIISRIAIYEDSRENNSIRSMIRSIGAISMNPIVIQRRSIANYFENTSLEEPQSYNHLGMTVIPNFLDEERNTCAISSVNGFLNSSGIIPARSRSLINSILIDSAIRSSEQERSIKSLFNGYTVGTIGSRRMIQSMFQEKVYSDALNSSPILRLAKHLRTLSQIP